MSLQSLKAPLGLVLGAGVYLLARHALGLDGPASVTAGVTALCAAWWCTEAVPIPVTSLLPFIVFPLTGVLGYDELASAWGDKFILLFMGGFMISKAAEKSRTHLRVAKVLIRLVGTSSNKRVIIGFLLATAFSSMWISNTATALIMLPVAIAVIQQNPERERFAVSLLLAIAYGSSVGGVATLIGTPPNGIMAAVYEKEFGAGISFIRWMKIGVPVSIIMLAACALVLTFGVRGGGGFQTTNLGPWTRAQRRTLAVISLTALLWITRDLPDGIGVLSGGWGAWLDMPSAHEATVALLAVLLMFLIPSGTKDDRGNPDHLLDWETARDIPWGILLLFAGGIAIAKAFSVSGLAQDIGLLLERSTSDLPLILVMLIICFTVTFTTEVTSNTAITTLLMPILAAAANESGTNPALLMIPAALSASCAFMLPVATPPNAIVFGGSDIITIPKMARRGIVLNLVGVVVIALMCYLILDPAGGL